MMCTVLFCLVKQCKLGHINDEDTRTTSNMKKTQKSKQKNTTTFFDERRTERVLHIISDLLWIKYCTAAYTHTHNIQIITHCTLNQ